MDKAAAWVGAYPIGPKCLEKMDGKRLAVHVKVVKSEQPDLFGVPMINEEFENHVARLFVKPQDHIGRTLHAAVGIAGEAGEVLDAVKKTWIYGKELDRENLLEESGDLLFYIVALLTENGFTLEDAMQANIEKLKKRYPEGYTDSAAIERADKVQS
jgi:NTP pyrophosphatase (non-canonical NTP hydrolase)